MKKTILHRGGNGILFLAVTLAVLALPCASRADIFRWEDESGVVHFTDDIGNIPPKYRGRQAPILKGPPAAGQPSLSTVESPSPGGYEAPSTPPSDTAPAGAVGESEVRSGEADALRAKIAAKEQFLETVDRKRSNILNPLGNRFVSPEDLELYGKYKQELPQDRQRLRELESGRPAPN